MKGCSERSFRRKLGIIIVLWTCVSDPICLAVSGGNCSLPNGMGYPSAGNGYYGYYTFVCNNGFELVGSLQGFCRANRQEQFCQYKKCVRAYPCSCINIDESHDRCLCHFEKGLREWRCTENGWIPHSLCPRLTPMPFMKISYTSDPYYNHYVHGTLAKYSCTNQGQLMVFDASTTWRRKCSNSTWSDPGPIYTMCACKKLSGSVSYSYKSVDQYYPIGTMAYVCDDHTVGSVCTKNGWAETTPCPTLKLTRPPDKGMSKRNYVGERGAAKPTQHQDEEKTLIIVSGTTGAILGTLIVLVVIVTCQRRLHYHRMRRARLRCRQDQDAFAAYITYQRDVRFMLPSYDEAVNQQEQGQPPTFAEAIASNAEGGSPNAATNSEGASPSEASPPPPPPFDDVSILVPLDPGIVGMSSEGDGEAPQASSAEGRFFRAVRMLFGGRSFTSRAIYCHLVPADDGEENGNGGGVQSQPSRADGGSDGLNNGGEEGGSDNQGLEVDSTGSEQATRDLNELLSRAGLC